MKMKKDNKILIFGIIVVIVLLITVIVTGGNKEKNLDYANMSQEEIDTAIEEKMDNIEKIELGKKNERERIEYYVSTFMKAIENSEYDKAYGMLYSEFREKYFKDISSFEEYAKSHFPKNVGLEYTNIERNGDNYVLWITISSPLSGKDSAKEINFVVRENDLNDFVLSFSV